MSHQIQYNDFPTFLRKYFPYKVQKISLNAGFTCPNRDGTKGWGGCTYCNNQTFNPDYCRTEKSVATQLEEGKCFFAHKYPEMKYLAYFQAYTNTYADTVEAVQRTAACGILTGGHIILGLPGETHDTMVAQAGMLSELPLSTLKIHQLQLIRGTRMAHEYEENPTGFHLFREVDEYIDLVIDYVEHLHPDLVLERFVSQSPKELLIAPDWGLKNYEFVTRLQKRMKERGAYQGKKYRDSEKRVIFAEDNFTTE